jgi:hypothetical protein
LSHKDEQNAVYVIGAISVGIQACELIWRSAAWGNVSEEPPFDRLEIETLPDFSTSFFDERHLALRLVLRRTVVPGHPTDA